MDAKGACSFGTNLYRRVRGHGLEPSGLGDDALNDLVGDHLMHAIVLEPATEAKNKEQGIGNVLLVP